MIQRIQTIFLFLGAAVGFAMLTVPYARTAEPVAGSQIFSDQVYNAQDNLALLVLFAVAAALALVAIFLYRKRQVQMRLTIFSAIALIIAIALGAIFFIQNSADMGDVEVHDQVGAFLPVAGVVFVLLAYRFINKDDKLVRSMDRLR